MNGRIFSGIPAIHLRISPDARQLFLLKAGKKNLFHCLHKKIMINPLEGCRKFRQLFFFYDTPKGFTKVLFSSFLQQKKMEKGYMN